MHPVLAHPPVVDPVSSGARPASTAQAGAARRTPVGRLISRAFAALLLGLAVVACGDDADTGSPARTTTAEATDPQFPAWIDEVYPIPDASTAAERAVTVSTKTLEPTQELRLLVDDVDVTAQALVSEPSDAGQQNDAPTMIGRLRYEPASVPGDPLVPLGPGEHSATAELRARPAFGEPTELVDSYTWTFVVQ